MFYPFQFLRKKVTLSRQVVVGCPPLLFFTEKVKQLMYLMHTFPLSGFFPPFVCSTVTTQSVCEYHAPLSFKWSLLVVARCFRTEKTTSVYQAVPLMLVAVFSPVVGCFLRTLLAVILKLFGLSYASLSTMLGAARGCLGLLSGLLVENMASFVPSPRLGRFGPSQRLCCVFCVSCLSFGGCSMCFMYLSLFFVCILCFFVFCDKCKK